MVSPDVSALAGTLPLPPFDLRQRVGAVTFRDPGIEAEVRRAAWWDPDPAVAWLRQGAHLAQLIERALLEDRPLRGARVLDFGCGAGRVLRHLVEPVGPDGVLAGVDIDAPSIAWLQAHAAAELSVTCCGEEPELAYADASFDIVYAFSVFTHLSAHWAGWLLELRRVLSPDGVLFATCIGRRTAEELSLPAPPTSAPGMFVHAIQNGWDHGGPVTVHDPAWLAERWGRAFDIVAHTPRATGAPWPHDIVVARPRPGPVTVGDLLAPGADGIAEGQARAAQLALLRSGALAAQRHAEAGAAHVVAAGRAARATHEVRARARRAELQARRTELERRRAELMDASGPRLSAQPDAAGHDR